MKQSKKFTYPISMRFKDSAGMEYSLITQLYQIGVYTCITQIGTNNRDQLNLTPNDVKKLTDSLSKNDEITIIDKGRTITVHENDKGLWEKINL